MLKQIETEETKPVMPVWTPAPQVPVVPAKPTATSLQPDLINLARMFDSRHASVRAEAEQQLSNMDVPALLALMASQRQMRKKRLLGVGMVCAFYFLFAPILAFWTHSPMIFMYLMVLFGGIVGAVTFRRIQKSAAMALAQLENLDAIGELVASLEMRDEEVQRVVRPALTRLLPRLQSSDTHLLNEAQKRVLRLFMEDTLFGRRFRKFPAPEEEAKLLLAALKALEQVGDDSFLPVVTQWAEGRKYGADSRIRQAAGECLAYLQQGSAQRQSNKELLRASTEDRSLDGQALLRPAADVTATASEELLRPSDPS